MMNTNTIKFETLMDTIANALPVATGIFAEKGVYPDSQQWAQFWKSEALNAIANGEDVETFIAEWTEYAITHGIELPVEATETVVEEAPVVEVTVDNVTVEVVAEAEVKKSFKEIAVEQAKEDLGSDFRTAENFWKQLKGLKNLRAKDYPRLTNVYRVFKELDTRLQEGQVIENITLEDICHVIRGAYPTASKVSATEVAGWTDTQKREFIETYIGLFHAQTTTEQLKKENIQIVKLSLDDIEILNGNAVFSSKDASVFTADEIKANKNDAGKITVMRIVESSEDGISRMLSEHFNVMDQNPCITIFMGQQGEDDIMEAELLQKKAYVFEHGVTDTHTGIHYMFGFQNPSSCRKANFMFVKANDWNDIFEFWYEITGTRDREGFVKAFGDEVVFAKLLARISTRGSNSFDLNKINPKWAEKIAGSNVLYCPDAEYTVSRKYKTLTAPGVMEEKTGERPTVPADGQGLLSVSKNAEVAVAMRTITENEYDELIGLWQAHMADGGTLATVAVGSRLWSLIEKMPKVWQIRHGEKKGLLVMADLENIGDCVDAGVIKELADMNAGIEATDTAVALSKFDIIIPNGVRKFIGGEWKDYPLEICNYLKKKKQWVSLNPQFIDALEFENPNALNDIVRFWIDKAERAVWDISARLEFHNIMAKEEDDGLASNLTVALSTSASLMNETQIQKWSYAQFEKLFNDMMIGKIMVPGMYSYMICDPYFFIENVFKVKTNHLKSGEYYHNEKDCYCGLFRSPLLHPFEAQKVKLCGAHSMYWYLKDVIIFNGYDGLWDRMGGGDFDGDTCAIIPDDTWQGAIIVNGIRCLDFDVWEKAPSAIKSHFVPDVNDAEAMKNFLAYLPKAAKVDRTGIITNENTRALGISNHLRSAVYFAKELGCEGLYFVHPGSFGPERNYGNNFTPITQIVNGKKMFTLRGLIEGKKNKQGVVEWDSSKNAVVGEYSFEDTLAMADKYLRLSEILRTLQGREIDGAKTGVYAEGLSGNDYIDEVKVKLNPHCLLTRQVSLGRRPEDKEDNTSLNTFVTLAPWGRVHDFIKNYLYNADGSMKVTCLSKLKENGVDKSALLYRLLNQEERNALKVVYNMTDGTQKSLIDILAERKSYYNTQIHELKDASKELHKAIQKDMGEVEADDVVGTVSVGTLKAKEVAVLEEMAKNLNIPMSVMAAACYLATYQSKDGKPTEGVSYAWLLIGDLLSVFSRNNDKFGWFRLPMNTETACIKDKVLYVNDKKHSNIEAYDCDNMIINIINGRKYGWVHRAVQVIADKKLEITTVSGSKTYTIGGCGFKFHTACGSIENWKAMVKANNYCFDITEDESNRMVMSINGQSICAVSKAKDTGLNTLELLGKTVKLVNNQATDKIVFNNASIANLKVQIVGDMQ